MELGSPLFSVCFTICLLGATRKSNGGKINCPCPEIPDRNLTETPPTTCFQTNDTFRYTCLKGYVRKAGTSNRIKCEQSTTDSTARQWTNPSLRCIPDPRITTTKPPRVRVTLTKGLADIPYDSTITTAVTAASTSLQMTQHISISASVTAESHSTEPTSSVLWIPSDHSHDFVKMTRTTDGATSTSNTSEPSNNSTAKPIVSGHSSTTTSVIICVSLAIICAFAGISLFCYKRRSANRLLHNYTTTPHKIEEHMPMNVQSTQESRDCSLQPC